MEGASHGKVCQWWCCGAVLGSRFVDVTLWLNGGCGDGGGGRDDDDDGDGGLGCQVTVVVNDGGCKVVIAGVGASVTCVSDGGGAWRAMVAVKW